MNALILSAVWGIILMFCSILVKNKKSFGYIAAFGLLTILIGNIADTYGMQITHYNIYPMLSLDRFGLLFNSIAIASTLIFVLLSTIEIRKTGKYQPEFYTLIFFVLCGISILTSYQNLLMLFLGIEILSIPLYILTGSDKKNLKSNEASLKYFLMGAFSTGIMLMGIALIYGGTGTFNLQPSTHSVVGTYHGISFLEITGLIILMCAMAFKASVAPFHFWAPDVYDGAPTPVTSFMAMIVKAAAFIAFFKLCEVRVTDTSAAINWKMIFSIMIVATLFIGNITAIFQQSVKRMLAYSSIAQAGFMMFAIFSLNDVAKEGLLYYALAYSLATIGLFATMSKMKDYTFEGYNGLAKKQPTLAATNAIFLLSLAGIPLTAGFFAKYYMLASVLKTGSNTWLVIVGVCFAAISIYYYFRLIQSMYFKQGNPETVDEEITPFFKNSLIVVAVLIVLLGAFPQLLLNWFYF
ncbi:MAG: NADH-quinone oxidoreductase subunit N [Chitinophagaceae bacterium]